jgi:hypothetical protein
VVKKKDIVAQSDEVIPNFGALDGEKPLLIGVKTPTSVSPPLQEKWLPNTV